MAFTKGDRSEVLSLLSKITTTLDAVGRSKRDIGLVLKAHPEWDSAVRAILLEYMAGFSGFLNLGDSQETRIVDRINAAVEE